MVYSNIDPTCCPAGKSVITSIFVASQEVFKGTLGPNGEQGEAYHELKDQIEAQFMKRMSEVLGILDLAEHAEVVEVAMPITLKQYVSCSTKDMIQQIKSRIKITVSLCFFVATCHACRLDIVMVPSWAGRQLWNRAHFLLSQSSPLWQVFSFADNGQGLEACQNHHHGNYYEELDLQIDSLSRLTTHQQLWGVL